MPRPGINQDLFGFNKQVDELSKPMSVMTDKPRSACLSQFSASASLYAQGYGQKGDGQADCVSYGVH